MSGEDPGRTKGMTMEIFVSMIQGEVEGVWVRGVPFDFTDEDVAYSVEFQARTGDYVARQALPYIRCSLNRIVDGSRVYKD